VTPALVVRGQSPRFLCDGARAVAEALLNGRLCVLPGQSHDINPDAPAPVLKEFLAGEAHR
jgi:pimeloyl-ACP methyl ester carboxylesterase